MSADEQIDRRGNFSSYKLSTCTNYTITESAPFPDAMQAAKVICSTHLGWTNLVQSKSLVG